MEGIKETRSFYHGSPYFLIANTMLAMISDERPRSHLRTEGSRLSDGPDFSDLARSCPTTPKFSGTPSRCLSLSPLSSFSSLSLSNLHDRNPEANQLIASHSHVHTFSLYPRGNPRNPLLLLAWSRPRLINAGNLRPQFEFPLLDYAACVRNSGSIVLFVGEGEVWSMDAPGLWFGASAACSMGFGGFLCSPLLFWSLRLIEFLCFLLGVAWFAESVELGVLFVFFYCWIRSLQLRVG